MTHNPNTIYKHLRVIRVRRSIYLIEICLFGFAMHIYIHSIPCKISCVVQPELIRFVDCFWQLIKKATRCIALFIQNKNERAPTTLQIKLSFGLKTSFAFCD